MSIYVVDLKMSHDIFNYIFGKYIIRNGLQITQNSLENPMGERGDEEFLIKNVFLFLGNNIRYNFQPNFSPISYHNPSQIKNQTHLI